MRACKVMSETRKTISDQDVGNLSRNINQFQDLREQLIIEKSIISSLDDPAGAKGDLSYRSRISEIEHYRANIAEGKIWLTAVEAALMDSTGMIKRAKEIAIALDNNTCTAALRDSMADEVESLLDELLRVANRQQDGRYIFAGQMTFTRPFSESPKGIKYNGDQGSIKCQVGAGNEVAVNIPGSDIFTRPFRILGEDSDLEAGIDERTRLADLNSGRGIDLSPGSFMITDHNLNNSITVTIPPGTFYIETLISEINDQLDAGGMDNLTVQYGEEGSNLRLVARDKPQVSPSTPLSNLNYGNGIGSEPYEIRIKSDDNSIDLTVDLLAASTIGDIIETINRTLDIHGIKNVIASLNPASTGIDIQDKNDRPLGLQISENQKDSCTAEGLGIIGTIEFTLSGSDLNPRPDFSLEDAAPGNTTAADIGILGNFHYDLVGRDLDPRITLLTPLAMLNNGSGVELNEIMIAQGSSSLNLNFGDTGIETIGDLINAVNSLGLSMKASINENQKGIQIESTIIGQTLLVEDIAESDTASSLDIVGSPDVFGNIIFLADALRNNNLKSAGYVIESLDAFRNHILSEIASVKVKMIKLNTIESQLMDYSLELTKLLNEAEGEDMTELMADLENHENIYTAALNSAARIIQPSLTDFIR